MRRVRPNDEIKHMKDNIAVHKIKKIMESKLPVSGQTRNYSFIYNRTWTIDWFNWYFVAATASSRRARATGTVYGREVFEGWSGIGRRECCQAESRIPTDEVMGQWKK